MEKKHVRWDGIEPGRHALKACVAHCEASGLLVLDTEWAGFDGCEIDIVAYDESERAIRFCEVRMREGSFGGIGSGGREDPTRREAAAADWLAAHDELAEKLGYVGIVFDGFDVLRRFDGRTTIRVHKGESASWAKREDTYDKYVLGWMAAHGYALSDLIEGLEELRCEREDAGNEALSLARLFAEWEAERGFGGEIWACREEWEESGGC